jgi:protein involved in polysaccharide export with SLBB domain
MGAPWAVLLFVLAGCTGPSNRFSLFYHGQSLIEPARDLARAAPTPAPLPRELDKRVTPPFVVEPGDVLLVQPADLESTVRLPGDQPVMPDGTIHLGRYGHLQVAGKTVEDIEARVKAVVAAQVKDPPIITVRVVSRVSKVFYVLGEVNNPGAFQLTGRETVLDALVASAGGLTDRASRQHIILSRPTHPGEGRVVLPICYNEIVQLGDTSTNYQLMPGDRLFVPSRGMCEDLCPKKTCPPCGGPQYPAALMGAPKPFDPAPPVLDAAPPVSTLPVPRQSGS